MVDITEISLRTLGTTATLLILRVADENVQRQMLNVTNRVQQHHEELKAVIIACPLPRSIFSIAYLELNSLVFERQTRKLIVEGKTGK